MKGKIWEKGEGSGGKEKGKKGKKRNWNRRLERETQVQKDD